MDSLFDRALATARQLGASDIHLKPGMEPILRINGELRTLHDPRRSPAMTHDFLHNLAMSLLNDRRRDILERQGDVTVALTTSSGHAAARSHQPAPRGVTISLHLVADRGAGARQPGAAGGRARSGRARAPGSVLVASGPGGGKTTHARRADRRDLDRRGIRSASSRSKIRSRSCSRTGAAWSCSARSGWTSRRSRPACARSARQDVDVLLVSEIADRESADLALDRRRDRTARARRRDGRQPDRRRRRLVGLWDDRGPRRRARALRRRPARRAVPAPRARAERQGTHRAGGARPRRRRRHRRLSRAPAGRRGCSSLRSAHGLDRLNHCPPHVPRLLRQAGPQARRRARRWCRTTTRPCCSPTPG